MKYAELAQKKELDLKKMLAEKRERLRQLRFDLASGKVKNVKEIHFARKDIARILTNLKSKTKNNARNDKA